MSWLVVFPFELIAASVTIRYWTGDSTGENASISDGVWIAVFLVIIIAVNIFGIRGYGEVEFILGTIKVIAVIGFILTGIIINCGGVPTDTRYVCLFLPAIFHFQELQLTAVIEDTSALDTGITLNKPSRTASRASAPSSSLLLLPLLVLSLLDLPLLRLITPARPSPRRPSRSSGVCPSST